MKTHSTITMAVVAFLAVCGGAQARVGRTGVRRSRATAFAECASADKYCEDLADDDWCKINGACRVPSAAASCSAKSCSDLGLPLGSNADVCGNSFEFGANGRATTTCLGGARRAAATHADAEAMCKNIGMRLCSVREVAAGELQSTGCGRDKMQVWTSTPCGTATGFATMRGNGAGPASCPIAGAQAEVRCCADSVHGSCTDFRTGTVDPPTPRTTTTVGALAATYQESALGSGFDDTAGAYLRSVGGSHGGCENRARREGAVYYSYATASKTCKVLKPEHQASEDDVAAFVVDPAKAMAGTKLYQLTWAPVTDLCSGDD